MADRDIIKSQRFGREDFASHLENLLEEQYLKQRRPAKWTQKKSFAPSGLVWGSGTCPRYWTYAFDGAMWPEDTTDATGIANMAYGTDAHTRIKTLFEQADVLVADEVEVKMSDPPIRGFIDVMVRWDGETIPGEIKTTREEAFLFRKTTMKPAPYHLVQILIYMRATGKDKGFLLYESKNDQSLLVMPVYMNDKNKEYVEYLLDWMRQVHKAWKEKTIPSQPFQQRNKICQECPFYEKCWENGKAGDIKIPKLDVRLP